jgi:hypothetical protein
MKNYFLFLSVLLIGLHSQAQRVVISNNQQASRDAVIGRSYYHASESIYTNDELLGPTFTTASEAIQSISFYVVALGSPNSVSKFKVWMKNVSSTQSVFNTLSGKYDTSSYQLVYNGAISPTNTGVLEINLQNEFIRIVGNNLQVLIERLDNTIHGGFSFYTANGNNTSSTAFSSRLYNGNTLPTSNVTNLTQTIKRPSIQFAHLFTFDASIINIINPIVSCYNSPQTVQVELSNDGVSPIDPGAATVTLNIGGANSFSGSATNSSTILAGQSEIISFSGIDLSNAGENIDTAFVALDGDGTVYNDTFKYATTTAVNSNLNHNSFITEDFEGNISSGINNVEIVDGDAQLWTLQQGEYFNSYLTAPITPRSPGNNFLLFDALFNEGITNTQYFRSIIYGNCITIPVYDQIDSLNSRAYISFYMSHDNSQPISVDSCYLVISEDKGQTWSRLEGFARLDLTASIPEWKLHNVEIPTQYNGHTFQIGFEGVSDWGNVIGIDDINIYRDADAVNMISFNARNSGNKNILNWETSHEINMSSFNIEHSIDGNNFTSIGEVKSSQSNSVLNNKYQFVDANVSKGTHFYRLKTIEKNSASKYSDIKKLINTGAAQIDINPNPVRELMNISFDADQSEKGTLSISDISGRKILNTVLDIKKGYNNYSLPVYILKSGSYLINVQLSNQKIVKQFNKL